MNLPNRPVYASFSVKIRPNSIHAETESHDSQEQSASSCWQESSKPISIKERCTIS